MVKLSGIVIGAFFFAVLVFAEQDEHSSTLQLVSVVFRHGHRTPVPEETYPTDPYRDPSVWQDGIAALTKTGKLQMYHLGQFLRSRYGGFLSDIYSPSDILVQSSDYDRCLMSADTLLAGLFPPRDFQVWNQDLAWQPIPVHAVPKDQDKFFAFGEPCPKYEEELELSLKSTYAQELNAQHVDLYKYLSNHTGQTVDNMMIVFQIYQTLRAQKWLDVELPEWSKEYYPDKMKLLAAQAFALKSHTPVMKRLRAGPLIALMRENMKKKEEGTLKPNRKVFLYSGHDMTVDAVMRSLGHTDFMLPEYGASLLIEMHTSNAGFGHEIKIFYLNDTTRTEPILLNFPECGQPCFLDTFLNVTLESVPVDWDQECLLNP